MEEFRNDHLGSVAWSRQRSSGIFIGANTTSDYASSGHLIGPQTHTLEHEPYSTRTYLEGLVQEYSGASLVAGNNVRQSFDR